MDFILFLPVMQDVYPKKVLYTIVKSNGMKGFIFLPEGSRSYVDKSAAAPRG